MVRVERGVFSMVFSKVLNVNMCIQMVRAVQWYSCSIKCVESNLLVVVCEFVYSVSCVFVEGPLYKKNMLSENFCVQSPLYTLGRSTSFKRPPIVLG